MEDVNGFMGPFAFPGTTRGLMYTSLLSHRLSSLYTCTKACHSSLTSSGTENPSGFLESTAHGFSMFVVTVSTETRENGGANQLQRCDVRYGEEMEVGAW